MMYHGKMGWTWTELYTLPVAVRNYFYRKLVEVRREENEAQERASKPNNSSQPPRGPAVIPR